MADENTKTRVGRARRRVGRAARARRLDDVAAEPARRVGGRDDALGGDGLRRRAGRPRPCPGSRRSCAVGRGRGRRVRRADDARRGGRRPAVKSAALFAVLVMRRVAGHRRRCSSCPAPARCRRTRRALARSRRGRRPGVARRRPQRPRTPEPSSDELVRATLPAGARDRDRAVDVGRDGRLAVSAPGASTTSSVAPGGDHAGQRGLGCEGVAAGRRRTAPPSPSRRPARSVVFTSSMKSRLKMAAAVAAAAVHLVDQDTWRGADRGLRSACRDHPARQRQSEGGDAPADRLHRRTHVELAFVGNAKVAARDGLDNCRCSSDSWQLLAGNY